MFLDEVIKVAEENVEKGKDPQLTKEQYEQVNPFHLKIKR